MGQKTLANFRDEIVAAAQRGTAAQVGVTLVNDWIHRAMYEFGYVFKFHELEGYAEQVLLANTRDVVFPTDYRVMNENGIEVLGVEKFEGALIKETRAQFIRKNRITGASVITGRPKYYHIYGTQFIVRPKPDVDYTLGVHYWKKLTTLADGDVSIFDDDWDDIIMLGGLYRCFRHFNEFDRYQNVRNDFLGMIRSRKLDEDLEEFPEGGVSGVSYKDREQDLLYGSHEISDGFRDFER